eukprot:148124-Pelagomonas_calceolata.AAC.10
MAKERKKGKREKGQKHWMQDCSGQQWSLACNKELVSSIRNCGEAASQHPRQKSQQKTEDVRK